MIIDFHTHAYREEASKKVTSMLTKNTDIVSASDATLNGLLDLMEKSEINKSIVLPVATNPLRITKINDYSIMMNNRENNVIYFGAMHPNYNDIDAELSRIKNMDIKGIKIHPCFQETNIDDPKMINLINLAFKHNLIVLVHAGFDPSYPLNDYSSVDRISNMLNKLERKGTLVLAHLGGLLEWSDFYDKLAGKDFYIDTALSIYDEKLKIGSLRPIDKELLLKIIKKHGANKILFGSDSPWIDPKYIIDSINSLDIDDESKDMILYKNALKLLGEE